MDSLLLALGTPEHDHAASVREGTYKGAPTVDMNLPDGWDAVWFDRTEARRLRDWLNQYLEETKPEA